MTQMLTTRQLSYLALTACVRSHNESIDPAIVRVGYMARDDVRNSMCEDDRKIVESMVKLFNHIEGCFIFWSLGMEVQ